MTPQELKERYNFSMDNCLRATTTFGSRTKSRVGFGNRSMSGTKSAYGTRSMYGSIRPEDHGIIIPPMTPAVGKHKLLMDEENSEGEPGPEEVQKDQDQLASVTKIGDAPGVKELAKFSELWEKA